MPLMNTKQGHPMPLIKMQLLNTDEQAGRLVLAVVRTSVLPGSRVHALVDVDLEACCRELEDYDVVLLQIVAVDDLSPVPPQHYLVGVLVVAYLNMLIAELAGTNRNAPREGDRQPRLQRSMEDLGMTSMCRYPGLSAYRSAVA